MAAATKKKRVSSKGKGRKKTAQKSFSGEIILLLLLAVSIILFLSNFGLGGFLGNAVSGCFFGIFGMASYIFPAFLFVGAAFFCINRGSSLAYKKLAAGAFFLVFLCGLLQLLTQGETLYENLAQYYWISSEGQTGGGIVGGAVSQLCCFAFGVLGAYILLVFGEIILLIVITQKSFLGFIRNMFMDVRERTQEEQQERKRRRKEEAAPLKEPAGGRRSRRKAEDSRPAPVNVELAVPLKEPEPLPEEKEKPAVIEETIQNVFEIQRGDRPGKDSVREAKGDEEKAAEPLIQPADFSGDSAVYKFPPMSLLKRGKQTKGGTSDKDLRETAQKLQETLHNFGVNVTITNVSCGPTVTRYELQPEQGVKVSKIVNLADDIKLNLATADIRIEAPIPGKAAVGIEVPNKENSAVMLRDLLQSPEFQNAKSKLAFAAGKDIAGKPVITDIAKMPHLLIAGATGSGKSVCINTLIMSVLYKAQPDQVKMIMIDPKVVELSVYNGIPHLLIPVVTDPKKAAGALNWAVAEMTNRYNAFAEYNVRNLEDYSQKIQGMTFSQEEERPKPMPQIIIIVDELADLMMVAPGEVEDAICRLAQLARAAGIHLIIATQRPSVNVITGLIKANMPSRIAFAVSSGVDSRTILDMNGAEKLLGKGDMLFYPQGYQKPARLQGAFVSDEEVSAVVEFLSDKNPKAAYDEQMQQEIATAGASSGGAAAAQEDRDVYFADAGRLIIEKEKASIGMLQRAFKIGFNRAARIMDQLFQAGVVGPEEGTKPRKALMSAEEFEEYIKEK